MLKPVGVEPPLKQTKITDAFPSRSAPPPTRPSIVLSLLHHMLTSTLKAAAATVLAPVLVEVSNAALATNPQYAHVRVSAAKWTPKGNLVIFAGPGVSCDALYSAAPLINSAVSKALPEDPRISACLNVKWGKVLINFVPTGVIEGHPTAHSPATCWQVLLDNNPALFHYLKVCQLPSWVRRPSLFQLGSSLSLVFSFEDPDGTITLTLIKARNVYAFGAQCRVKQWKNPQPNVITKHSRRRPTLLEPLPYSSRASRSWCLQCQCQSSRRWRSRVLSMLLCRRTRRPPPPLHLRSGTLPPRPPPLGALTKRSARRAFLGMLLVIPLTP